MADDARTAARRAELAALYGDRLTPAQVDDVLAAEAAYRRLGAAVNAVPLDNGELPFVPLAPEET